MGNGKKIPKHKAREFPQRQQGFTYLLLLFAICILGVGLAALGEFHGAVVRRQQNVQLAWIGEQYRQAIGSYYQASPGPIKTYPRSLDDLLADNRTLLLKRHLRTIYLDPFTGRNDWELIRAPDGGILGIQVPRTVSTDQNRTFIFGIGTS
jgi:type II secretory pathway pseudopilin PulG